MLDIVKMLTSFDTPQKECVIGNEAVVRGAVEAGVRGVFSYPGTPSTEISEMFNHISQFQVHPDQRKLFPQLTGDPIYFEYSVNEKVALEKGIAFSLGNRRAMCCMKSAGMNVASDPLMTIAYQVIGKALVIVVCDDPGCSSSSNEQDSRYWGKMASVPVFNPSTPDDALNMIREAFALSEQLKLPVIMRMTTRVNHSRGIVDLGKITPIDNNIKFYKSPRHLNIPARTAAAHRTLLEQVENPILAKFHARTNTVQLPESEFFDKSQKEKPLGIITSGVAHAYALEVISRNGLFDKIGLLKVGITHPFPVELIRDFLSKGFGKVLILEELDPIVEEEVRILAQKDRLDIEILGKDYAGLLRVGEYNLDIVRDAVAEFTGLELERKPVLPFDEISDFLKGLPPRPPTFCPGCPHRATFYALKLALPFDTGDIAMCGDIGCFALGAFPPFQLIDTIHHMGMSISMAQGLSEAIRDNRGNKRKTVALLGDGTFFHSGVASLMNAVYSRENVTVVIFDNRTIGMTGHQEHPGSIRRDDRQQVDLKALLKGMGVKFVETVDPNDIKSSYRAIKDAIEFDGVAVVVAKSPCVFLSEFKQEVSSRRRIEIDHTLCNTCYNQEDTAIECSRIPSDITTLTKARARIAADYHIPAVEQLCPANICNHGFFNAILEGDFKAALDLVRDKMIFAQVCGDICPRPCEFLFRKDNQPVAPIRKLKQYAANLEENFDDFTIQLERASKVQKKDKSVAIVGAGPAGLSAAYDLIREGYNVTVFEKEASAGGLLKYAIPDFRIDKEDCDREIAILGKMGVDFRFNTRLGKDTTVESMSKDFDAVILAIGMGAGSTLKIVEENIPSERKYDAIAFLRDYNLTKLKMKPNSKVFVLGGGNSAIDAARTAHKIGADVTIIYRRSREKMPAFDEEVEAALSEGVRIVHHCVVSGCSIDDAGKISVSLRSFKDDRPMGEMQGDYIITAVGQMGDSEALETSGLETDSGNRIVSEPVNGRTGLGNVFVAGDVCAGNHVSVIGAIGSGKKAATGVRQLLEGYPFKYEGQDALNKLGASYRIKATPGIYDDVAFDEAYICAEMPKFDLYQACGKCNHCIENFGCPAMLNDNGKIVIDDLQCTRCGLCIDICLNGAIHWVEA